MDNLDKISEKHLDILREIENIGAGNATTALAVMLNRRVNMNIPEANLVDFQELEQSFGQEDDLVVGVVRKFDGDIHGMIMFVLKKADAQVLVHLLIGEDANEFSDMGKSVLLEVGNIISGAYLSSVATLTNFMIVPSMPSMAIDMAGAIFSVPAIEFGKIGDKAIMIKSQFMEEENVVNGCFIMMPDLESYRLLMKKLEM